MRLLPFSRRALQQRLHELRGKLAPETIELLGKRMDRRGNDRIPAVWETVWLHALGQAGTFEHEVRLENGSRPDFRFQLPGPTGAGLSVVGDITCVSDRGVHENNPAQPFWDELWRQMRAFKLDPNHFRCDIGHRTEGEYPDQRFVLRLPKRGRLPQFIKQQVGPWLRELAQSKAGTGALAVVNDEAEIKLGYNTAQQFAGGGHIAYTSFASPTRNPLVTQLTKKERQLRHAPGDALRLVILCDAGCQTMKKSVFSTSLSADEIVSRFLKRSSVIDMVVLVSVEVEPAFLADERKLSLHARIAGAPAQSAPRRTVEAGAAIRRHLDAALANLPAPVLDAHNASLRTDMPSPGTGSLGVRMSSSRNRSTIALSARVLLDLLAGRISLEEFQKLYGWHPESFSPTPNPFTFAAGNGQLITGASLQPAGDADDDWIELEFGPPDPAAAPFGRGS